MFHARESIQCIGGHRHREYGVLHHGHLCTESRWRGAESSLHTGRGDAEKWPRLFEQFYPER